MAGFGDAGDRAARRRSARRQSGDPQGARRARAGADAGRRGRAPATARQAPFELAGDAGSDEDLRLGRAAAPSPGAAGALLWSQSIVREDSVLVPLAEPDTAASAFGLKGQSRAGFLKTLDKIRPEVVGKLFPVNVQHVHLFMGTHIEAVAGECILQGPAATSGTRASLRPVAAPAQPASLEREWLLRALLVLQAPRAVFSALHDDSDDAAHARQEPILALTWLAGIAGVLVTSVARHAARRSDS